MKKFVLEDRHLGDGFNVNFPNVDFSTFTPEVESIREDPDDNSNFELAERKMKEAQDSFKKLITLVNSVDNRNIVALAFCREMSRTHRTLQQAFVSQLLIGIHAYARWAKDANLYDDRNRGFIQMVDDLEKILEEHGLPFI